VANNTNMTVSDLLAYLDHGKADGIHFNTVRTGGSYTTLPTFLFYNGNASLLAGAQNVFGAINALGL
jgi:hypothetical protein